MASESVSATAITRILEVRIDSASFSSAAAIKNRGKIYGKIWMEGNGKGKLKTGNLCPLISQSRATNSLKDDDNTFVFSFAPTPGSFSSTNTICVEIYRARKHLRDKLLGRGKCRLGPSLFGKSDDDDQYDELEDAEYDSSDDDDDDDDGFGNIFVVREEKIQKEEEVVKKMPPPMVLPELKGSARIRVERKKGRPAEVAELGVEVVVWKGHVKRIGECELSSMAMKKQEFMGLGCMQEESKMAHLLCLVPCLGKSTTSGLVIT